MFFFEKVSSILDRYNIHFKGLKQGKHLFEFGVDNTFFEQFPEGEISKGDLKVTVLLHRHSTMLELEFNIEGKVEVACDRCLEPINIPLSYEGILVVKFSQIADESNDELWVLSENEYELQLAQYIYESICLSLPIQRFHGMEGTDKEGCDETMLKRISQVDESKRKVDPRWDKLSEFLS